MKSTLKLSLALAASAAALAGCVAGGQGQIAVDSGRGRDVSVAVNAEPAYQPMPADVYIAAAVDTDVVIYRGDTYIWVTGANGVRHRQFYAHGDHRRDVFHRREELHHVMMNHGGHLPTHAVAAHGPEHAGFAHAPEPHPGNPQHGGPGRPGMAPAAEHAPHAMPAAHAGAAPRQAPAKPVPRHDEKKS